MGNRTRIPDMQVRLRTRAEQKAAQEEALRVIERWNAPPDAARCGLRQSVLPSSPARHGSMFTVQGAAQAARSTSERLIGIRSPRLAVWCSG
jgi:hypothetical protein